MSKARTETRMKGNHIGSNFTKTSTALPKRQDYQLGWAASMVNDSRSGLTEERRSIMKHTRRLCAILIGAACLLVMRSAPAEGGQNCTDTQEGTICQVQQPLVAGTLVDINTQKNLGLVTVGGG